MSGVEQQEAPNTANRVAWDRVMRTGANFSVARSEVLYAGSLGVSPYISPNINQVEKTPKRSTAAAFNRPRAPPKHGQITNETTADFTLRYYGGTNSYWL